VLCYWAWHYGHEIVWHSRASMRRGANAPTRRAHTVARRDPGDPGDATHPQLWTHTPMQPCDTPKQRCDTPTHHRRDAPTQRRDATRTRNDATRTRNDATRTRNDAPCTRSDSTRRD
jgi:hypothetical protein